MKLDRENSNGAVQARSGRFPGNGICYLACLLTFLVLLCSTAASAQIAIMMSPAKIEGNKAVVKLGLKNNFTNTIESARISIYLLDNENKTVGRATRWVIGSGKGQFILPSGGTNVFYFVITAPKPFATTNLTAKLIFNRGLLENGKLIDVKRSVEIHE
jgi:hypothetical protein